MEKGLGLVSLVITTVLWGTSFPAIKVTTEWVDGVTYTWTRGIISLLGLVPVVLYMLLKGSKIQKSVKAGLITGIFYALGLWFQGWGTSLTSASSSGFITGLNVVIVYGFDAIVKKEPYGIKGLSSLILSIVGLYLISGSPSSVMVGDILVLVSAFLFAAQIELIHKYSSLNPAVFTFFEMIPMLGFGLVDAFKGIKINSLLHALPYLLYLGLICNDVALTLQVLGQRWFKAYEAALIFLLEPVFAAIFQLQP